MATIHYLACINSSSSFSTAYTFNSNKIESLAKESHANPNESRDNSTIDANVVIGILKNKKKANNELLLHIITFQLFKLQ